MTDLADNVEIERRILQAYPILEWFQFNHLPPKLVGASRACYDMAWEMAKKSWVPVDPLGGSPTAGAVRYEPELAEGLRKLLEAKDCLVRAAKKLGESPRD